MRLVVIAVVLALAACTSSSTAVAPPSPSPGGYLGSLGTALCKPPAAFHAWHGGGLWEVGLDSRRGSLWALFFSGVPPPASAEIKVVWRMTGAGDFIFRATDADGVTSPLVWGPDAHGGSNWSHPGDEVGTGFNFAHSGCWRIHVGRQNVSGDLWLAVAAKQTEVATTG